MYKNTRNYKRMASKTKEKCIENMRKMKNKTSTPFQSTLK